MDSFTLAEFAKSSENKEDASFTPQVQEAGIEQGALIVSRLYNTMLGEITKIMRSWNAELTKVIEEGGLTPSPLTNEQLYTAILKIINRTHGRNIGDVYYSQSGSAEDNPGALPLFTGELVSNVSSAFPEFCTWLFAHPSLCITQAQYDIRISQYGECPFYVYNVGADTIRLPKLVNYIKMANTVEGISQKLAGLPNITGNTTGGNLGNTGNLSGNGALYQTSIGGSNNGVGSGSGRTGTSVRIDASRSSSVYGNSDTVTPAHTTLFPWVTVYNVARPASEAQAAEFIGSLSGKADIDLGNVTTAALNALKRDAFRFLQPDLSAGVTITSGSTVAADGWIWVDGYFTGASGQTVNISINGVSIQYGFNASNTYNFNYHTFVPVRQGDVWVCDRNCVFYPLKGAN